MAQAACTACLSLFLMLPAAANTCYVSGDTNKSNPAKPLGSAQNAYSALAQVEADAGCVEIIVLYSETALDGGITLKDGQRLIGIQGPAGALPVISNSSADENDGNAVNLARDNRIENLHFRNCYQSAVFGGNPGDFKIESSLITQFAQSGSTISIPEGIIFAPPGIYILADSDITIDARDVEIREAKGSAIQMIIHDGNAEVVLENVAVRDLGALPDAHISPGVSLLADGHATVETIVRETSVTDIGEGQSNSDGMLFIAFETASYALLVDGYQYTNLNDLGGRGATGLEIGIENGQGAVFDAEIRNSVLQGGASLGMQVIDQGQGNNNSLTTHIHDNEIYDSGASGIEFDIGFGSINATNTFTLDNNLIVGAGASGIELYSIIGQQDVVNMLLEKNTILDSAYGMIFSHQVGAGAATLNLDAGLGALGSIGRNTIIGSQVADVWVYTFDCCGFPQTPPFHVSAAGNWWGSADGPANVLEEGAATVDVSPVLTEEP